MPPSLLTPNDPVTPISLYYQPPPRGVQLPKKLFLGVFPYVRYIFFGPFLPMPNTLATTCLAQEPLVIQEPPLVNENTKGNIKEKFRLAAKKLFLTFPNIIDDSSESPPFDLIFEKIKNNSPELAGVIIAKELHQNEVPHYHIFIEYCKKFDTTNPHHFDFIFNKHGNYTSVKNLKQTIKYITKNNNYKEYISTYTQTKDTISRLIRTALEEPKCKTHDLYKKDDAAYRDLIYQHANKVEIYHKRYHAFLHEKELNEKRHIITWDLELLEKQKNPKLKPYITNLLPLLHFLNRHMFKSEREYKSPHLLIWSAEPNFGKSSLMNFLIETTPTYQWPSDNWYELYTNYLLQVIIWDEFTLVGHSQEFLKLLFSGGPIKLPIKGSQIFKKDNPLIFCGSNYSLKEHIKRKYSMSCKCQIPNDRTLNSTHRPLCHQGPECTKNTSAILYYNALCARIKEYKLPGPIFPNGEENSELWNELKLLLKKAANLSLNAGEPRETREKPNQKEWKTKLDQLINNTKEKEMREQMMQIFSPIKLPPHTDDNIDEYTNEDSEESNEEYSDEYSKEKN